MDRWMSQRTQACSPLPLSSATAIRSLQQLIIFAASIQRAIFGHFMTDFTARDTNRQTTRGADDFVRISHAGPLMAPMLFFHSGVNLNYMPDK